MIFADAPSLPLIRHFGTESPLACVHNQRISAQRFISQATLLAARLPQGRYVLNLCEDRYHFLLGFAAALIARQVTLMPSSRAAEAIARVQSDFDDSYCLSDQTLPATMRGCRMTLPTTAASEEHHAMPRIASDQEAAILFTSGTTGRPIAHRKTWGMLVQGANQLQHAFGVAPGSYVVGTIPPQHMFGLESTIMFPLQWGCTIFHGQPHLPADIEQVVSTPPAPVWLMTTPLHLRACVTELRTLTGIAGVISATMPLTQAAAQAAEHLLNCPLYEIYGSTEAGITATRRPAQQLTWQLCPDFSVRQKDEQSWLEGPRVMQPLDLNDRIAMHGRDTFSLQGRVGDMIKIAGKRTSLAALNAELLAIDGITDGTFYRPIPDGGNSHDLQRLTAFVVSDRLSIREVVAALRTRIDPVFIPRPIWKVPQLPRDANGKLPRDALATLAQERTHAARLRYDNSIAPDHPALDGHFPGNPIVPGVLLLSDVMRLATRSYRVSGIKQAKFHVPLLPQQAYAISFGDAAAATVKFDIRHGQILIASGILQLSEVPNAST